ncbi:MAG: serpin family protein [Longimicrobiales bacterium]
MTPVQARKIVTPSLLFTLLAAGCGTESPTGPGEPIQELPRALSLEETLLIEAGNDFAFRFLQQVQKEDPSSNLFLAPLSASMALGMTLNGAGGNTYEEMKETLGFGSMSLAEINQGYRDLIDLLVHLDPRVEMGIGNSIWYREGFVVRADFVDRAQSYFDAVVQELDFSDARAPGIINGWVRDRTGGKIEEIVDAPIPSSTVMFLINATYFKGKWTHRFDKGKTSQASFFPEDGTSETVPLMEITDTLPYTETGSYQAVDLPYGGGAFSMTVLLPRGEGSVHELVASLTPSAWREMIGNFTEREGTVHLPRFRLEWGKLLNQTLQAMGMVEAFLPGAADFTGLSDQALEMGLFVSKVKQKSYVDVNEEGTEAAGVTMVQIDRSASPDRFDFRADRPFLFVIRERFSGTVLFAGTFHKPPTA